ncbi:helix-turn-helix domain-containing protein [Chitinophagaceae bacterium LB-8]|uniref:Helix-turn-helix domain-containing protein n=1 Tax=Paraflavisolibacter caeni TaxID=2982496 RepID=A0A9X2XTW8_9BACT|nr:AraC family transcriptional regulator [Paraflavisolibacter caeni]MCU7547593.1 helix-turn-helix domain-containing protein [Paraflavisolibacter caeni]
MKLFIKNMVCSRCIMTVEQILKEHGIKTEKVNLGEAELAEPLSDTERDQINQSLQKVGFELLDDLKKQQIEKIKSLIIQKVQSGEIEEHFILSNFLAASMFKDYSYLSKLFSEQQGITIEQFFIQQKIEKVKEWLIYDEFALNEISWKLGYSSVQHLSAQFKRVTGMTPSTFKKTGNVHRKTLDNI